MCEMANQKMTVAQALIRFLKQQYLARDGKEHAFFAGVWGIFGHGNVSGLGQALEEDRSLVYYQARNEQAMVHAAIAFAKQKRRLQTFACTSSIGPGATNMVTAAALATINRLPVLLLPGDIFARRQAGPVLQQLETRAGLDVSVNDCLRPVSCFWDRIYRWEQLLESLPEAMRVLSSSAETGAVTICLPQDVQTEAGNFPDRFFEPRIYTLSRPLPDETAIERALAQILQAERPLLIAGGGVNYSEAEEALSDFCRSTGIPSAETQAGKGALPFTHAQNLGAIGCTGTRAANLMAQAADLVIAVGTRLADFTTASGTQFQNSAVSFIGINIDARDASKYRSLALIGDCKVTLRELTQRLVARAYRVSPLYAETIAVEREQWFLTRETFTNPGVADGLSQGQALGLINAQLAREDTLVGAAGSLPGDMHKLLHVHSSRQYHMEYGYSCMGYEIAGGLGVKMSKSTGDVFVLVGDGSYLMMHSEIVTALQEAQKLIILLFVNHKFASIDGLSRHCGSAGFGNEFRKRSADGQLNGAYLAIDYVANARSLGAESLAVSTGAELEVALQKARQAERSFLIAISIENPQAIPSFATQWNVPIAELSQSSQVAAARKNYVHLFERNSDGRH